MRHIALVLVALMLAACDSAPKPDAYESKSQYCQAVAQWFLSEPYALTGDKLDALETARIAGCWRWNGSIWHEEDAT